MHYSRRGPHGKAFGKFEALWYGHHAGGIPGMYPAAGRRQDYAKWPVFRRLA